MQMNTKLRRMLMGAARTYVLTYVRMYVCTYVRTYVHTYVRMYKQSFNIDGDVDGGENANNEDASETSNLHEFHLSALRMSSLELFEKKEESRRNLRRNRMQNLRSVNSALAADRELAEKIIQDTSLHCVQRP